MEKDIVLNKDILQQTYKNNISPEAFFMIFTENSSCTIYVLRERRERKHYSVRIFYFPHHRFKSPHTLNNYTAALKAEEDQKCLIILM